MFISFRREIEDLVDSIIDEPMLHGRWLNTLSYLENCGARKIASCEHPTAVKEEMLKHAAEEFRHAFYLKKQLGRIRQKHSDYRFGSLLGGWAACHYLKKLEVGACLYLRSCSMSQGQIKELAYLLVTYAIELRAGELYPIYQAALRRRQSKVQVQSILLEEKEHLQEMQEQLNGIPGSSVYIEQICSIEAFLFKKWKDACFYGAEALTHR